MKEIITEAMKKEIEEIANSGHAEALIAFGHDMFHQGELKGLIVGAGCVAAGSAVALGGIIFHVRKNEKEVLEELEKLKIQYQNKEESA